MQKRGLFMPFTFCPLYSGSSGNALYIGSGKTHVLIDAGVPGKAILDALATLGVSPAELSGILITHEHSDHIRGAGILSRKWGLPIYANAGTWQAMEGKLGNVPDANRRVFATGEDFYIRDLDIQSFPIPHDAAEPVGYCIHNGGRKIATATDIGHINAGWLKAISGANILMLEANHDLDMLERGRYPQYLKARIRGRKGHLSNVDSGKALSELIQNGLTHCVLGHLSEENNLPELAYQTVCGILSDSGIRPGRDCHVDLAGRHGPSARYTIA